MIIPLLLVIAVIVCTLNMVIFGGVPNDFTSLYRALINMQHGLSPYKPWLLGGHGPPWVNLNVPLLLILARPLAKLSLTHAYLLWQSLSVGLWGRCIFLAWRQGFSNNTVAQPLLIPLLAIGLLSFPMLNNLLVAQVGTFIGVLVLEGFHQLQKKNLKTAGLWWGLATYFKFFPGLLTVYLIVYRQWRTLAVMLTVVLTCHLYSLAHMGSDIWLDFGQALARVDWYGHPWNASLFASLTRLLNTVIGPHPQHTMAMVLTILLTLIFALRMQQQYLRSARPRIHFAWTSIAMIWFSPLGWIYYWPVALVAFAVLLEFSLETSWLGNLTFALALVGLLWPTEGSTPIDSMRIGTLFVTCLNSLGLMLLFMIYWLGPDHASLKANCHNNRAALDQTTVSYWLPLLVLCLMLGWDVTQYLANLLILFLAFAHH